MSTQVAERPSAVRHGGGRLGPILAGLAITAAGVVPWLVLSPLNRTVRPEVPWAAAATGVWLLLLLSWLHGVGWPRRSADARRRRLRLWPPRPDRTADGLTATQAVALLALMTVAWVAIGRLGGLPDLTAYPTTAYRWSSFLIGGIMSGVVEEAAFRGYMQTGLEERDPDNALWITSAVFAAVHLTHGLSAIVLLPGFFAAGMLYAVLARRTGTILPGMLIHVGGDLAYTYFGVLGGDGTLLFVR